MGKIEIRYERKMSGSYMKINGEGEGGLDEKMLVEQQIAGLLPMEKCFVDGGVQFWYDISGKQSLDIFCRMKAIGQAFLEQLVHSVCEEICELEQHLVDADCLCLKPEVVYVSNQTGEISFTAIPGRSDAVSEEFRELVEYLLTKVDHKDAAAVRLAYDIYEKSLEEGYRIADIQASIVQSHMDEKGPVSAVEQQEMENDKLPVNIRAVKTGQAVSWKTWKEPGSFEMYGKNTETQPDAAGKIVPYEKSENEFRSERGQSQSKKTRWSDRLLEIKGKIAAVWKEKSAGRLPHLWKVQRISGKRGAPVQKPMKGEPAEWRITYPDEVLPEKIPDQTHPTVCLNDVREHPEGLLLYEGHENFSNIRLDRKIVQIGYADDSDIVIAKNTISRYHARIECENQDFFLEDLNSTNGTFVNEKQLDYKEKRKLEPNDRIRFADVMYRMV